VGFKRANIKIGEPREKYWHDSPEDNGPRGKKSSCGDGEEVYRWMSCFRVRTAKKHLGSKKISRHSEINKLHQIGSQKKNVKLGRNQRPQGTKILLRRKNWGKRREESNGAGTMKRTGVLKSGEANIQDRRKGITRKNT